MIKKFLIAKNASVKDAMKQMNTVGVKALFIANNDNRLLGSLTDGDIRRWILKEGNLKVEIEKICKKNPIYVKKGYKVEYVKQLMLNRKIEWIPVVNEKKKVVEVLFWN